MTLLLSFFPFFSDIYEGRGKSVGKDWREIAPTKGAGLIISLDITTIDIILIKTGYLSIHKHRSSSRSAGDLVNVQRPEPPGLDCLLGFLLDIPDNGAPGCLPGVLRRFIFVDEEV